MDSVSEAALRCGAELVVHGYKDGRAPGSERLDAMGLEHPVYAAEGTSEDIAMLLAYEQGAELIDAVGTHSSMVEFFDKRSEGRRVGKECVSTCRSWGSTGTSNKK